MGRGWSELPELEVRKLLRLLRSRISKCTINALMSAGLTPPIRLACPIVIGRIFASFSRASIHILAMFSYVTSEGILRMCCLSVARMRSICRSMYPLYLSSISTTSFSETVRCGEPKPWRSRFSYRKVGRQRSSARVIEPLIGPPASTPMTSASGSLCLMRTVCNRFLSVSMARILSSYTFHRRSSIRPISRPRGVSLWSALSDRRMSRCSEREVSMRYGSLRSLLQRSSRRVPI
mmetsp:Transcript_16575/g.27397  ORF Transcript_16575/g.27397 Transcript_16575/m.27397 type:complete len:235 (-) Transcript_16575:1766-2470(-)